MIESAGPWGTGPYQLVEGFSVPRQRSDRVVLEANPHYWDRTRRPRVKRIVFDNTLSQQEAVELVKTTEGRVDLVSELRPLETLRVAESPWAKVVKNRGSLITMFGLFNRRKAESPWRDVRRAFDEARPDVVHAHFVTPMSLAVLGTARRHGVPILGTNHALPEQAIEIYGRSRGGTRTYVVKRGDTLGGIARKHGTTVSALMRLNGLKKPLIHPGQELVVRGSARSSKVARSGSSSRSPSKAAATKSRTSDKSTSSTSSGTKPGAKTVAKR